MANRLELNKMKPFIITIAILYAIASSSNAAERKANEYCFKNAFFLTLEKVKSKEDKFRIKKEDVIYLPDEYKYCEWSSTWKSAEIHLNDSLMLRASYGTLTNYDRKKYDSIFVSDIHHFYCTLSDGFSSAIQCGKNERWKETMSRTRDEYECEIEEDEEADDDEETDDEGITFTEKVKYEKDFRGNFKYNHTFLPILKSSIGKTFTVEINVEVSCPSDAKDKDYSEEKTLKINRPIIIIGECWE